jgi:hypothetical protein
VVLEGSSILKVPWTTSANTRWRGIVGTVLVCSFIWGPRCGWSNGFPSVVFACTELMSLGLFVIVVMKRVVRIA